MKKFQVYLSTGTPERDGTYVMVGENEFAEKQWLYVKGSVTEEELKYIIENYDTMEGGAYMSIDHAMYHYLKNKEERSTNEQYKKDYLQKYNLI